MFRETKREKKAGEAEGYLLRSAYRERGRREVSGPRNRKDKAVTETHAGGKGEGEEGAELAEKTLTKLRLIPCASRNGKGTEKSSRMSVISRNGENAGVLGWREKKISIKSSVPMQGNFLPTALHRSLQGDNEKGHRG